MTCDSWHVTADGPRLLGNFDIFRTRDDTGSLVAVLILVVALAMLIVVTVTSVIPSFGTASSSQNGEQAVAQANAGISDALFRLDQANDIVVSFCIGNPPLTALTGSGLTTASCSPGGTSPLPAAPGLLYYVVKNSTSPPASGISQMTITSSAVVSGQTRTATETVFRVADPFGFFGVSGFTADGSLAQASVSEVAGNPPNTVPGGSVDFGIGAYGAANCNGASGANVKIYLQKSATSSGCGTYTSAATSFTPKLPAVCTDGQVSMAFTPCIDTIDGFVGGATPYCPLPGTGFSTGTAAAVPATGAVFDCRTTGGPVTIGGTTLPFGEPFIPAGSYYFDSNAVHITTLLPTSLAGTVNLFLLPSNCPCTEYMPTAASNLAMTGNACSAPFPPATPTLSLDGAYINSVKQGSTFTPGDVGHLSVYWSGNAPLSAGANTFAGTMYAPGASMKENPAGINWFGSLVFNCLEVHGSPGFTLAYPEHATQYLQGWTTTNYRITS